MALAAGCSGSIEGALSPRDRDGLRGGSPGSATADATGTSVGVNSQALKCTNFDVGATPLQRLSRRQYVNSIRDLLGVTVSAESLPEDEKVGVFDGNTVGSITDLFLGTYITTAEDVARRAMPKLASLVPCDRAVLGDVECATQFVTTFGQRVHRRPLDDDDRADYVRMYTTYKAGGYDDALRVIVQSMLQSPHFLSSLTICAGPTVSLR